MNDTYFTKLCELFQCEINEIEDVRIANENGNYEPYLFNIDYYKPLLDKIEWNANRIDRIIDYCEECIDDFNSLMDEINEKEQIQDIRKILDFLLEQEITIEQNTKIKNILCDYFA